MIESTKTFGIGCFVWEIAEAERGREWLFSDWKNEVSKALSAMPNVTEVLVDYNESELTATRWTPEHSADVGDEPQTFEPELRGAVVEFQISIPRRLHPELLDGVEHACEKFEVVTVYEYHGPVTFVTCLEGAGDGALAVRLLCRYFQRELTKYTKNIKFTIVGPSPFHIKGTLTGVSDQAERLAWNVSERVGYARYNFTYDISSFVHVDAAYNELKERLADELSLFYAVIRLRNAGDGGSVQLMQSAAVLIKAHRETGLEAFFERVFSAAGPVRNLGLVALQAKVSRVNVAKYCERNFDEVYAQTPSLSAFKEYVRAEIPDSVDPGVTNVLEIVKFMEGGRSKEMELAVLGSATLLGGVAGALVALIAR